MVDSLEWGDVALDFHWLRVETQAPLAENSLRLLILVHLSEQLRSGLESLCRTLPSVDCYVTHDSAVSLHGFGESAQSAQLRQKHDHLPGPLVHVQDQWLLVVADCDPVLILKVVRVRDVMLILHKGAARILVPVDLEDLIDTHVSIVRQDRFPYDFSLEVSLSPVKVFFAPLATVVHDFMQHLQCSALAHNAGGEV